MEDNLRKNLYTLLIVVLFFGALVGFFFFARENRMNMPYLGLIFAGVSLVCYIIAQILSSKRDLVITTNTADKVLLIVGSIAFLVHSFASESKAPDTVVNVALGIALLAVIISFVLSYTSNTPNALYIILSIMAKIFLLITISVAIMLLIVYVFISAISSSNSTDDGWQVAGYDSITNTYFGYRKG